MGTPGNERNSVEQRVVLSCAESVQWRYPTSSNAGADSSGASSVSAGCCSIVHHAASRGSWSSARRHSHSHTSSACRLGPLLPASCLAPRGPEADAVLFFACAGWAPGAACAADHGARSRLRWLHRGWL